MSRSPKRNAHAKPYSSRARAIAFGRKANRADTFSKSAKSASIATPIPCSSASIQSAPAFATKVIAVAFSAESQAMEKHKSSSNEHSIQKKSTRWKQRLRRRSDESLETRYSEG